MQIKQIRSTTRQDMDGNIKEEIINKTINLAPEPNYIKLYLQDIMYLSSLPVRHSGVLYELLKRTTYAGAEDGMQVVINNAVKRRIQKNLGYKNISSVNNALVDLVKGNILYRIDVGIYNLNPFLFGKGDWSNIHKLRLEIDYTKIDGRTFKANLDFNDEDTPNLLKLIKSN